MPERSYHGTISDARRWRWVMSIASSALTLHSAKYYRGRAAHMRNMAEDRSITPQLRKACLQAAADYDALAQKAEAEKAERNEVRDED